MNNDELQTMASQTIANQNCVPIGLDDTFVFGCNMCGKCCRNRSEPILLTGYDVFRISKHLNMPTKEMINKYCSLSIGPESKLPILTIKQRIGDQSCSFLRKGKCLLHDGKVKPVVCSLFPLGRMIAPDGQAFYMIHKNYCGNRNETHVVKDWLNDFDVQAINELSFIWNEQINTIIDVSTKLTDDNILEILLNLSYQYLYLELDITGDYAEKAKNNLKKIEAFTQIILDTEQLSERE